MKQFCMSFALLATVVATAVTGFAQGDKLLSPPAEASGMVGGHKVTIKYGAPSVRGRKIFGSHEPFGQVWRAGANEATSLSTGGDLMIGDLSVPKGNYTLYVLPVSDSDWKLIVNKQTGQWGTEYDQSKDLGRVSMKVTKSPSLIETMAFKVTGSTLTLQWENTIATVPLKAK